MTTLADGYARIAPAVAVHDIPAAYTLGFAYSRDSDALPATIERYVGMGSDKVTPDVDDGDVVWGCSTVLSSTKGAAPHVIAKAVELFPHRQG